jgi:hypothetical protein
MAKQDIDCLRAHKRAIIEFALQPVKKICGSFWSFWNNLDRWERDRHAAFGIYHLKEFVRVLPASRNCDRPVS